MPSCLRRESTDRWLRPTLLGAAFRAGELDKELASLVEQEGAPRWTSTLGTLEQTVAKTRDAAIREARTGVLARLRKLVA